MGPWKPQYTLALVVAGLLACSVSYFAGKKQGVIDAKLVQNRRQIAASDSVSKIDSTQVDTAKKASDILTVYRDRVRAKVVVQHDTVRVQCDSSVTSAECHPTVTVSPEIGQLIEADDSTIAAQARTIALQDTLIASLRVGMNLRDERIQILEKQAIPGKLQRIFTAAKWIATGAVIGVAYSHR